MKCKPFVRLLAVILFAPMCSAQINDNFNDNSLNSSIWNTLTPSPGTSFTVSETNQRLEVTLGSGFGGAGIVSACQFTGDFDVQVDYILLNWPATNLHSVRLGAPSLGEGPGGGVGLSRSSFQNGNTPEFYTLSLPSSMPQIVANQLSAKLRLVRTGSTLSGFVMDGTTTWTLVGFGPVSTAATHISLDLGAGSSSAQGGVSTAFDNFSTNSGTTTCPGGGPSSKPDLSIPNIRPVQVVYDSDANGDGTTDLVLGKATAFEITVQVVNPDALPASVPIELTFEGNSYRQTLPITASGTFDIKYIFNLSPPIRPTSTGIKPILATIDPDNAILESDETNNQSSKTVEVKSTTPFRLVFVPVPRCLNPFAPFDTCWGRPGTPREDPRVTALNATEFVLGTYPISDNGLVSTIGIAMNGAPITGSCFADPSLNRLNFDTVLPDMAALAIAATLADPLFTRAIGVVPADYFDYHGLCGLKGLSTRGAGPATP